jgi:hypothetical protein
LGIYFFPFQLDTSITPSESLANFRSRFLHGARTEPQAATQDLPALIPACTGWGKFPAHGRSFEGLKLYFLYWLIGKAEAVPGYRAYGFRSCAFPGLKIETWGTLGPAGVRKNLGYPPTRR